MSRGIRVGIVSLAVALGGVAVAPAQQHPAPFPRESAAKAGENPYFAVWESTLRRGQTTPMYQVPLEQVTVFMNEGPVKFTHPDGSFSIEQMKLGSVRYVTKGTVESMTGLVEAPVRMMTFQLKDAIPPKRPVVEGVVGKLEGNRPGVSRLFETDRFIVYDYTWIKGMVTPRHLHYHIDGVVYLVTGKTKVLADGRQPSEWKVGQVLLGIEPLAEPHMEAHYEGDPRAIAIQLKDR